ncbi:MULTISPECIES: hypothetical protein [Snodgrassella]|uniref:hypothetical protein n=1 Tax=Snodgrassella TaxID=1193515 RepID=UPI00081594DB|nr:MULTISPECIES: hypothetical protein [Snodgrassella]SCB92880.1 hypothetical protein GA0061082_1043 [Snodgrassella sp. R-53583]
MGKKARLKRERRENQEKNIFKTMIQQKEDIQFVSSINKMKLLFRQYKLLDIALAISVSELWPMNVTSPAKHALAWSILLELSEDEVEAKSISDYKEFSFFLTELYKIWPEFPSLEDYSLQADWGQIKVRLGSEFVPIFYGSDLNRVPDFIESFRISFADNPEALADMDLVIAIQSYMINSFDGFANVDVSQPEKGYVEVPPKNFWYSCTKALVQTRQEINKWVNENSDKLITSFGTSYKDLTQKKFVNNFLEGFIVPYIFLSTDELLIPISVRQLPGKIIDYWANKNINNSSYLPHIKIAEFLDKRFADVYGCREPIFIQIDKEIISDLRISCVVGGENLLHLICYCKHNFYQAAVNATNKIYIKLQKEAEIFFILSNNQIINLKEIGKSKYCVDDIRITLVLEQKKLGRSSVDIPQEPAQFLPLADFISIYDSIKTIDEIEQLMQYIHDRFDESDSVTQMYNRLLSKVDWYASFCFSKNISCDDYFSEYNINLVSPCWGNYWRFKKLAQFWHEAPERFPDNELTWEITRNQIWSINKTDAIKGLVSFWKPFYAYSTNVGTCTVQAMYNLKEMVNIANLEIHGYFAYLIINVITQNRDLLVKMPFMQQKHIVFECKADKRYLRNFKLHEEAIYKNDKLLSQVRLIDGNKYLLVFNPKVLYFNSININNNSFEIRCLLELLKKCHEQKKMKLAENFITLITEQASKPQKLQFSKFIHDVEVPINDLTVLITEQDMIQVKRKIANTLFSKGLKPGRYQADEAKPKIKAICDYLKRSIESMLQSFNKESLIIRCIEQLNAALVVENTKLLNITQDLLYSKEDNGVKIADSIRTKNLISAVRYRYLLEKVVSLHIQGQIRVTDDALRELYCYVYIYFSFNSASDVLHHSIADGGLIISEDYIPNVFFINNFENDMSKFQQEHTKNLLGLGVNTDDNISGLNADLIDNNEFNQLYRNELGFEYWKLLFVLIILTQPQRHGLSQKIDLVYNSSLENLLITLQKYINSITEEEARTIVEFLTLPETKILQLSSKNHNENEVPYWEYNKRPYRHSLRPLVYFNNKFYWGAELTYRTLQIWRNNLHNGFLPADFNWPNIKRYVNGIKVELEKKLEKHTIEIFKRYTQYVVGGLDFYDRFKAERFDDVGDFDGLAYWPEINVLVYAECKYIKPVFVIKDSRRLRDEIFGSKKDAHMKKIAKRRAFVQKNRQRMLELLGWPVSEKPEINIELYISKDLHFWMVAPPDDVPTKFVCIEKLDSWIKTHILNQD